MKFKVGDYVENIKYLTDIYFYGIIIDIDASWIETLILCIDGKIIYCDFKANELKLLKDENKINNFNKLRVFE